MKRDENVYQHLLRELRQDVAEVLGLNPEAKDASPAAILRATIYRSLTEIDVIIAELDRRENAEVALNYPLVAIRDRLSLAVRLSEGIFDPDDPWETASAGDYFPGGAAAYCAAMEARHRSAPSEDEVTP